ncbi:MAG TPA: PAS domain-containing protein [Nitrospira sp.]|nr:PAS domain-containing protein [Nitrospira sp.]
MPATTFSVYVESPTLDESVSSTLAAAHRSQLQYEDLVGSLEAIVWRANAATCEHVYVSEQAESVLGYPIPEWIRQPGFKETRLHPDDRMKVLATYRQAAQDRTRHRLDYRMTAADGRQVWFHECVHSVIADSGHEELIGVMMDISDRKAIEQSLIEISGRLIHAQEQERCRIARELHDDFNQRLALLAIGLERLGQTVASEGLAASQVSDLCRLTQGIASDVHRLSHQLHSAKLEHLGLVPAIKGLCRELREQYGAHITFVHRNVPKMISKESALCLFRVAQEALSNTMKHSGVRTGQLELFGDRDALHLCISDRGAGFDPESVSANGHLGLISMQERVRAAGGTIAVESGLSRGTRISVHLAA